MIMRDLEGGGRRCLYSLSRGLRETANIFKWRWWVLEPVWTQGIPHTKYEDWQSGCNRDSCVQMTPGCEVLFCPPLPCVCLSGPPAAAYLNVVTLRPLVPLVRATCRWRWVRSIGGMILTGETEVLGEKSGPEQLHHKSHMAWPGIEHGPPRWEAGDWPPEPWHCIFEGLQYIYIEYELDFLHHREQSVYITDNCDRHSKARQ